MVRVKVRVRVRLRSYLLREVSVSGGGVLSVITKSYGIFAKPDTRRHTMFYS